MSGFTGEGEGKAKRSFVDSVQGGS
jgi:hypothetical protein